MLLHTLEAEVDWIAALSHAFATIGPAAADTGYVAKAALAQWTEGSFRPWRLVSLDGSKALLRGWAGIDPYRTVRLADAPGGALSLRNPIPCSWDAGETAVFTLKTIPVVRSGENGSEGRIRLYGDAGAPFSTNVEKNAAYRSWLFDRLDGKGCRIEKSEVESVRLVRALRRSEPAPDGSRSIKDFMQPEAVFRLTLTVTDPKAFRSVLADGIGPQKAFGYGALLPE